ncbi:MAG: hypothetical protein K8L99_19960 [Anaerolineae bacterium]|nr:hypothetical protein [Anaerolineae bacterium]
MSVGRQRASQTSTAVFLIGLGLLFLLNLDIWPYIMFVIAIALLASEYFDDGHIDTRSSKFVGAVVVAIVGLLALVNLSIAWGSIWPFILIAVGVYLLYGDRLRR